MVELSKNLSTSLSILKILETSSCNENILLKSSMLEEMIHKKTLVSVKKNVKSQAELNMFYHIYLHELIQNIKNKYLLKNKYTKLENFKS